MATATRAISQISKFWPSGNVAGIAIDAAGYTENVDGSWTANGSILLNNIVEVVGTLQFNESTQVIEGDAEFWLRGLWNGFGRQLYRR